MKRNLCPRFLANLYTTQVMRTKWGNVVSELVAVTNGVKQGGVMSPIFFIVYMDELLHYLSSSGVGCCIGNVFCGSYDVPFNSKKSKLIVYNTLRQGTSGNSIELSFMNGNILQSNSEKHLGNIIGVGCNQKIIDDSDMCHELIKSISISVLGK